MMARNWIFIAVFALLIVVGLVLGWVFSPDQTVEEEASSSFLSDQTGFFEPPPMRLFSEGVAVPNEEPMEPVAPPVHPPTDPLPSALSALFVEPAEELTMTEPILPLPTSPPLSLAAVVEETIEAVEEDVVVEQPAPDPNPALVDSVAAMPDTPATTVSVVSGSYIYFFTGVPVQPAPMLAVPMTYFSYTSGFTFTSVSVVSAPVVQPYVVPVFVPQVVPNGVVGARAPKWGYSNGTVFKPLVYFP